MNDNQIPGYSGPNFCPNCGCSIRSVAMAIALTSGAPARQPSTTARALPLNGVKPTLGRPPKKPPTRLTPDQVKEITRRRLSGESVRFISNALGLKYTTVTYCVYHRAKDRANRVKKEAS